MNRKSEKKNREKNEQGIRRIQGIKSRGNQKDTGNKMNRESEGYRE